MNEKDKDNNNNQSEMIIYTTEDGLANTCEIFSKKESFKRKQYGQKLPIL
ncbi:MAG: hypothetical protein MRZ64_08490 [[Bacteroides] pectinophilus]|nr:hypothetical protein [[Bacteroides] pectinophilus]